MRINEFIFKVNMTKTDQTEKLQLQIVKVVNYIINRYGIKSNGTEIMLSLCQNDFITNKRTLRIRIYSN